MKSYRFVLEKYHHTNKNRYTCPSCGRHKEFTRYVDTEGNFIFPETVGKCNRTNNCGYHYPPAAFFRDNPEALKELMDAGNDPVTTTFTKTYRPSISQPQLASCIDKKVMCASCSGRWYANNNLFLFLCTKLGQNETTELFKEYHVGTSKKWNGAATVFWQVSIDGEIRTGKIMLYHRSNGHRMKEGYSRITWAHSEMKLENFHLEQCFFGEHLLKLYPDKPVAIVESEKSALISAAYMREFVWIASGGKNGCLHSRYHILQGRRICLFPDSKAYDTWYAFYTKLKSEHFSVSISNLMEENTSDEQWNAGIDIADILLQRPLQEAVLGNFLQANPALQLLIDAFGLEPV